MFKPIFIDFVSSETAYGKAINRTAAFSAIKADIKDGCDSGDGRGSSTRISSSSSLPWISSS